MKKTNKKTSLLHKLGKTIKSAKINWLAFLLTLVHFPISLLISNSFFTPSPEDGLAKRNELLINILFFGMLYSLYYGAIFFIRNRKKYRKQIKICLLYFILLIVLLVLTWPGVWRGPNDDFVIAIEAKHYSLFAWHHILTSILYMLSFKLFPFFSGVLIIQCLIISIITTYLYCNLQSLLKISSKIAKILLFIPFLLPPVLDYALYPLRTTLYAYFVVLLLFIMIKCVHTRQISKTDLMLFCLSATLSISWRSEGLCFFLIIPVFLLYCLVKKRLQVHTAFLSFIIIVFGFLSTNFLQNASLGPQQEHDYKVVATARLVGPLIREAAKDPTNNETLSDINKLMDINLFLDNPERASEDLFYDGGYRNSYSEEEYQNYFKAFLALAIKYPKPVLKNSLKYLMLSTGTSTTLNNPTALTRYYDDDFYKELSERQTVTSYTPSEMADKYENAKVFLSEGGSSIQPINSELRNTAICLLENRNIGDYIHLTPLAVIFWNTITPMICTTIFAIILLIRKKFMLSFIVASIFIKTAIVFITAPLALHMYYYSEYLFGYIILFAAISYTTSRYITNRHKKHQKTAP